MTKNRKGRTGCHQATQKTSKSTVNFTGFASRIKASIVTLALWGMIPITVADWLIQHGGLRNE